MRYEGSGKFKTEHFPAIPSLNCFAVFPDSENYTIIYSVSNKNLGLIFYSLDSASSPSYVLSQLL